MRDDRSTSRSGSEPVGSEPSRRTAHPKPPCKLIGTDGNVYAIVGRVKRALGRAGQPDRARDFVKRAFASKSYDEVLAPWLEYVEIE